MPLLISPDVRLHTSFVEAMAEFRAEGRGAPEDGSMVGRDIARHHPGWRDESVFAQYVESVRADARADTPRPEGHVPATSLWYVEGDTYLGRIASARRRGHATAMLRTVLPVAGRLGIDRALVTCDPDNIASRKVIEACGGVLGDERCGKLRFWIRTDAPDGQGR